MARERRTLGGSEAMSDRLRVMLATEGTYPFHQGGVSTWCHLFINRLQPVDFVVYSVMMNPYVTQKFNLRPETELIKVPLWGTEDPSEHLSIPFSEVYLAKRRTDERVIREHFIPLFDALIKEIFTEHKDAHRLGMILSQLNQYFGQYDYRRSFTSEQTWDVFKRIIINESTGQRRQLAEPSVFDSIQSLGWIYRFLTILNTPVPKVDVAHSAAAAFCGIPCVLAKLQHQTPFLLTEHGVYLREQYLSLQRRGYSNYLNSFLIRLLQSVSGLNYAFADQVSPVCLYNTRWEQAFGVTKEKIQVIYNGVDPNYFSPLEQPKPQAQPTVVSVARVDPVKDIVTLIHAAKAVRARLPGALFIVYGAISVPEYNDECLELIKQLDLVGSFMLAGHTDDVPAAYRSGDVIVLSSITEGFPYSVVEAMMTGKPVVATDVGGVREAVGDCGIVVRPRQEDELAQAIIHLLQDEELRAAMGRNARQRALSYFTVERALGLYLDSYQRLAGQPAIVKQPQRQRLYTDKGFALMEVVRYQDAIEQFRIAISEETRSPAVPVLLMEIAGAYNKMGMFDQAFHELAKAETLIEVMEEIPA